jgi:3-oxoadipate enol-lactonase
MTRRVDGSLRKSTLMETETVNGVKLALVDRGDGTPLVLAHGFPMDHAMWNSQIESLSKTHRVIAVDLRGFGQSEATDGPTTMEQFADDLAAVLDARRVSEPVVLCGLSMGGYIAFAFWRKYAARLRGLILCDTRAETDSPDVVAARRATAQRVLAEGPGVLVEGMAARLFAKATPRTQPELLEKLRRMAEGCSARGVAAASLGMALRPDSATILGDIRCPALVIVGQEDAISPPDEMRRMAGAIPNARLVVIPDAGHLSPMERPTEVNGAIEAFLREL